MFSQRPRPHRDQETSHNYFSWTKTPEDPILYFDTTKFNKYIYYMQSSMCQITVSFKDLGDVDIALEWVKDRMDDRSCLITHTAFRGQAVLALNSKEIIHYGYEEPSVGLEEAVRHGYSKVYLIWWVAGEGWYRQPTVLSTFTVVFQSGRIAIYLLNI